MSNCVRTKWKAPYDNVPTLRCHGCQYIYASLLTVTLLKNHYIWPFLRLLPPNNMSKIRPSTKQTGDPEPKNTSTKALYSPAQSCSSRAMACDP